MNPFKILLSNICVFACLNGLFGQGVAVVKSDQYISAGVLTRSVQKLEKKYSSLENKITQEVQKSLHRLERTEKKLIRKLQQEDSLAANSILRSSLSYNDLAKRLSVKDLSDAKILPNEYLPNLDSIQTSLAFFASHPGVVPGGIPAMKERKGLSQQVKKLDAILQESFSIKRILKSRETELRSHINKVAFGKYLKRYNREAYYYHAKVNSYKELLANPEKLEKKIISLVRDNPGFRDFMSRNSQLAALFNIPRGNSQQILPTGLQTRSDLMAGLAGSIGAGGNPSQLIDQGAQLAQTELLKLKEKTADWVNGSSEMIVPDFKPNSQKVKSFWKRLELGFNIQSQRANLLLPATSDLTLTSGYRLNDKSTIGFGLGYKLGWGKGLNDIKFSNQGFSIRSFADIKLRGSIWITGGYEGNFQREFTNINQLKYGNDWQRSGLLGVTKKYKIGKKSGNLQLLWDFLSDQQVPKTTPLKFRMGYVF